MGVTLLGSDIVWGRHCQGATLFQPRASWVGGDFAGGDFVGGELVRWRDDHNSFESVSSSFNCLSMEYSTNLPLWLNQNFLRLRFDLYLYS